MKILVFLLFLLVGVSLSFRCDYSSCRDSNPFEELGEVRYMPTAQQLRTYCPKMLKFLDCNIDVIEKCIGQNINDLAASNNESVAEATSALLGVGSLVQDICNPHATLHKDYVANIECFRGFIVVGSKLCEYEVKETMEDFYEKFDIEKNGLDDVLNAEIRCLEGAYGVTCLSVRLGESCGERARSAFVNVVRRLKPVFAPECGKIPSALKSQFMEYVQVDGEQLLKMKDTLDLFRRR